jgi:hypothetical protein
MNDDIGALTGEFERDLSPDPAASARTRDECDPPAEREPAHPAPVRTLPMLDSAVSLSS